MKLAKKLATMLMCVCLVVPCLSMMVSAATPGTIKVDSVSAKAGEEVTVSLKAKVDAGIGKRTMTISYDSQLLQFVGGTNVTKVSEGELEYTSEEGINSLYSEKELAKMTFKALSEGTATVKVKTYDIKSSFDLSWTCHDGQVTISGGTSVAPETTQPSDDATEETPSDDTTTEPTDDTEVVGTDAEVVISNSTTITLITDVSNIILPERYVETTVKMDGIEYPAWQDTENTDMYILYAYSSNGIESLYQYDALENTYQRFEASEEKEVTVSGGNWLDIFGDKANYVVIGAGALLVLFIIIIIVLSVKLYNRDAELDEVYDDLDAALAEKEALKKAQKPEVRFVQRQVEEETEDDVLLTADIEEDEEDDDEVEVEFYIEEPVEEMVEESVEEELPVIQIEEVVVPVQKAEEYYDDEDDFYDDLDGDFSVSFIDLDD